MKRSSEFPQEQSPKKTRPIKCINKIDQYTTKYKNCQFLRSKSKFIVEDIKECPNPAEELRSCIKQSIEEAIEDGISSLGGATKSGIIFIIIIILLIFYSL